MSTSENLRGERELIYPILAELAFDSRSREQLQELMQLAGFDDDVVFAKSLFSDRIAQLHAQHEGHYEKFLASEAIAVAASPTRELLFAVFRMYHERKLGKEGEAGVVEGVELPDCKDIDAIIKFQKRMYGLFKNLMPAAGTLNQNFYYPQQEMPKFAPFTLYPERTYRHFDNDYYSSLGHSPYLPAFPPKPYSHLYDDKRNPPFMRADSFQRTDSNRNDSFQRSDSLGRNDSFLDRPSLFPKLPSQPSQNKFDQPDFDKAFRSAQDYFLTPLAPPPREESIQRGFQAVQEEFEGQLPSKKVKKDAVEVMKRQLELVKKAKGRSEEPAEKSPADPPEGSKTHEGTAFVRRSGLEVHEDSPCLKDPPAEAHQP